MSRRPFSPASIAVLVVALVGAAALFFLHNTQDYSEPQSTLTSAIKSAANADLNSLKAASTRGYYEDLVGHFGERKYEQVRSIYQYAYDLAQPRWAEYRQRADSAALTEYRNLHQRVESLGRDAVGRLSLDERMRLTEDRAKYADFVFQEGIKSLPPEDRKKIEDVDAFRAGRDFRRFTDQQAWSLLSAEDRAALGSPATLSSALTPERMAFLEKIGVPLLAAEPKKLIVGISASELSVPRDFMLKYGEPLAKQFFAEASFAGNATVSKCVFPEEDQRGSLLRGGFARCQLQVSVRGHSRSMTALLKKDGFNWKVDRFQPDFFDIREAYPPKPARTETAASSNEAPVTAPVEVYVPAQRAETVALPRSQWERRPTPDAVGALGALLGFARRALVSPLLWFIFLLLFVGVMTANYRRLKNETFSPEWLEGEQQLDAVQLPMWWMRTVTRLTNRRILQVRLNWFFSRRKVYAIALDDVHSVTWRRYTNWLLLAIGVYLIGTVNPIALLLIMLGLEAKILSIRFNTPFAQMPWTRVVVTSFHRKHFNELARFFRKAQLHWAQVRTQKQLPVPVDRGYQPELDRDFAWGIPVWMFVGLWIVLSVAQRVFETHVTLDDYVVAPLLIAVPVAIAQRSRRDALWAAALGFAGMLTVKFPGSPIIPGLAWGADGSAPNFEQYVAILATLLITALAAFGLARAIPALGYFAPVLCIGALAAFKLNEAMNTALYAKCALAIAAAVALSWVDAAVSARAERPAPPEPAKAVARATSV